MVFGDEIGLLMYLLPLIIWEIVWKGIGMWKSARNGQKTWFVLILILNTVGILPIVYIAFFQHKIKEKDKKKSKNKKKDSKSKKAKKK